MGAGLRPTLKCVELPPDPKVRAPVPHPTGDATSRTVGGKHGGCIETRNRAHETTTVAASGTRRSADSLREPSRSVLMYEEPYARKCKYGSAGAPGEQSPGATRPGTRPGRDRTNRVEQQRPRPRRCSRYTS